MSGLLHFYIFVYLFINFLHAIAECFARFSLGICHFAAIGWFSVKTVVDRYRHVSYQNKHW